MNSLLAAIQNHLLNWKRPGYRPREAHYASSVFSCLRDQYWTWTGESETNPTDLVGASKLFVGNALEAGLINNVLSHLHLSGYHIVGTQVQVGGSNPLSSHIPLRPWHGALDAEVVVKNGDQEEGRVIEIKTKSGFGADIFFNRPEVSNEYLIQMGLYLHAMYKAKGITKGQFIYVLFSDKNFGSMVTIQCVYDPERDVVNAISYEASDGRRGELNQELSVKVAFERWKKLDEALAAKQVPAGEYEYMYELTPEILADLSDTQLKKLIDGAAVIGDWQVIYSRYKDKQISSDGCRVERSPEEIGMARLEYKKRHPKARI